MKASIQGIRSIRAVLTLAVFASWLGGTLLHNHDAAATPCKVCQVLQANQAELPSQGIAPRPAMTPERIAAQATAQSAGALILLPQERAPPLA